MNGYAVQDAWLRLAREQRERDARSSRERDRLRGARVRRAAALIALKMPDLVVDGQVCSWAISAAIELAEAKARGELAKIGIAEVRARRREAIERLLSTTGMTAKELGVRL